MCYLLTEEQSHPACQILQRHSVKLSLQTLPVETLYTEGVISKETFDEVESSGGSLIDGPLRTLFSTVSEDPNKLRVFGSVLLQSEDTVHVGNDILKEYGK